jgi:hypothetical protein
VKTGDDAAAKIHVLASIEYCAQMGATRRVAMVVDTAQALNIQVVPGE